MRVLKLATNRRGFLAGVGVAGMSMIASRAFADDTIDLGLPDGVSTRSIVKNYLGKGPMILQRTRPPLLETPFEVFDKDIVTPNDQFYVRWHWANLPSEISADTFRLVVRGQVNTTLSLSLKDLLAMPSVEMVAVNQCSGNSRGFFQPRVAGGEWANGSMGNARWTGVRLKDVLDKAGVKAGATAVRFNGLDEPVVPDGPDFMKSLSLDHARDGEVMIAYAMNGVQLPYLNGFPLRLVVPGWYATYWVKMLSDIEILDKPDDNFWMAKAYLIPDTPHASMKPGEAGVKTVPINQMVPRSFVTNVKSGANVAASSTLALRGIAFGGNTGVKKVELSTDGGKGWQETTLESAAGKYSFRRWTGSVSPVKGANQIWVRCTNSDGTAQPMEANWNPSGFMRNVVEVTTVTAA
jgi:DMSO/TMAO reductase YedYZ molybdopterin-dependent catalytic subunit